MRQLSKLFAAVILLWARAVLAQNLDTIGGLPATRPSIQNHADVVARLVKYHDYGQYDYEIRQVASAAMDYLQRRAHEARHGENLAAVFDIDETALSNWTEMNSCGFCDYRTQAKYYPGVNDPPIVPVLELFRLAEKLGVKAFLITGRAEQDRQNTQANLSAAGYQNWEQLIMRPNGNSNPARIFKSAERQKIVNSGYIIVLNIGDQASDLAGCCTERSFKLPNPFYLVP